MPNLICSNPDCPEYGQMRYSESRLTRCQCGGEMREATKEEAAYVEVIDTRLKARVVALESWQAKARGLLEKIQFDKHEHVCPICDEFGFLGGHSPDCALADLLRTNE